MVKYIPIRKLKNGFIYKAVVKPHSIPTGYGLYLTNTITYFGEIYHSPALSRYILKPRPDMKLMNARRWNHFKRPLSLSVVRRRIFKRYLS